MDRRHGTLNRRRFLGGVVGTVAGAAIVGFHDRKSAMASPPRGPVKILMDDVRGGGPFSGPGSHAGPVLESQFPFTHAGLHWRSTGGAVNAFARTSADKHAWSAWQPLDIEAGPQDTPKGETFATLIGAPRHRFLQYRISSGADTEVDSVSATFINSADGPSIQANGSGPTPVNKDQTPVTFTRDEWGAEEWRRFDADGNEIWPTMFVPHKKLVVHHTATSNSYADAEDAKAEVRAIYAYHATSLGWGDIGYNALVDKFGNVYEGRYGREDLVAETREVLSSGAGAGHALNHNYGSSGIALLGTHTKRGEGSRPGVALSSASRSALVGMLVFEARRNDLDPEKRGDYALWDWRSDPLLENDWNRNLLNVSGHKDCQSTICPGGYIYDELPELRAEVATELIGRSTITVTLTEFPVEDRHTRDAAYAFTYVWEGGPGADSYEYVLEGWTQPAPGVEEIDYLLGFINDDRRLVWSPTAAGTTDIGVAESGHYTFHVRALDSDGNVGYQDSRTFLLLLSGSGETEDPGDPGEPEDPEQPGDIVLEAEGYKVRGVQHADLTWSGATSNTVDIYRDGTVIATVAAADEAYTDNIGERGGGTYTYRVCETGTDTCSNEVAVSF